MQLIVEYPSDMGAGNIGQKGKTDGGLWVPLLVYIKLHGMRMCPQEV